MVALRDRATFDAYMLKWPILLAISVSSRLGELGKRK